MKSTSRPSEPLRRPNAAFVVTLLTAVVLAAPALAAGPRSAELPQDASQWINSRPSTLESLGEKGVVVVFFVESCPRCRERWPHFIEASKKYADKPVVFLAVNSGQPRGAVEQYVRSIKSPWPTIVDADRSAASGDNREAADSLWTFVRSQMEQAIADAENASVKSELAAVKEF